MKIESIINITENPFWISETLPYFFDGYAKDEIEIHVMYLILPFILTKSIREGILLSANSSSTFDSLFYAPSNKRKKVENNVFETFNESLMNKTSLVVIEEKYHSYKELMNKVLLIAYRKNYYSLKRGKISPIKRFDYSKTKNSEDFLFDYFKCSRNLGIVFKDESLSNLYRKCQISRI